MEYEKIKILKKSEKNTVSLVHEKDGTEIFVQKIMTGRQSIYSELQSCVHLCLPKIYEVNMSDNTTTIIEEYVEGQSLVSAGLSERQIRNAVRELCSVLEFLHGKDIIHRDIKPSNIILAKDGHIRLIDFDAARMKKDGLEQDTKLLGTRGYAPPEQYGFSQTDERTDIYSLGVTLEQFLGDKAHKLRYKRIIQKCTNVNPDQRYQTVQQVKRAFCFTKRSILFGITAIMLIGFLWCVIPRHLAPYKGVQGAGENLVVLPAPDNPRWDGETGIALWGNVPESGSGGQVAYHWRLYRTDTATQPEESGWYLEGSMRGNGGRDSNFPTYELNLGTELWENGYYYYAVASAGDGIHYADSPFVMSDVFHYTGESAPPLPAPTGLAWKVINEGDRQNSQIYAIWSNLDDYADTDSFNVCVYNRSGDRVLNNIWTKEQIQSLGCGGIWIAPEFLTDESEAYRFTVQVQTSRPNEYKSSPMPDPVPEEYYSPWYDTGANATQAAPAASKYIGSI